MVLGPHCRSGQVKVHGFLALSFFQFGRLRIPLLGRIGRLLGLRKVLEVGPQRDLAVSIFQLQSPVQLQILAHTDDDHPMASLRNPVVLALDQRMLDIVARCREVVENGLDGTLRGQQTLDVLGHEDLGNHSLDHLDEGLVESASLRVETLTLAGMAEVLARESSRHDIRCREWVVLRQKLPDISAHVVLGPAVEIGNLLGFLEDVVLEDCLKSQWPQVDEPVDVGRSTRPPDGNTGTVDTDLLGEPDVHSAHARKEGEDLPSH